MSEYYYTPTRSYHSSVSDSIPPPQPWSPHAYGNESYESAPGEQHFAGPTGPFDASTSQAYHCQEHSDAEYGEYGDLDYPPSGYARAGGYLPPTPSELQDTDTEGPISPTWDASELSPTVTYASFSLMTHGGRESVEASQTPDNGYGDMIGNRQYSTDTLTSHALYCHAAHPHPVASEDAKMFLAYPEQQYDLPIDRRQPAQDEYANFADYGDQMQGVDQMSPVFPGPSKK
ncbi:hypothetical protein OBBRIDRAFT_313922 [Obba rivulosa]|uniref:Uncharacterized protein n=1 Tax=Obba rivulosa TaxID=1052685 RepID=A0A8E2AJ04_9APHY|nr:hypothetical protein OBBRIDRAFT_313922 [Obba rivulosa]